MPEFVYDMSLEDLAVWCGALAVGVTWVGIIFVKPFLRLLVGGEPNVNDTISYATSVFSLFYGLLLGLLAVAAYENSEDVEHAIFQEAAALSTLYADLNSYPEPLRSDVKGMMRDYVLYTIHKEWDAHRQGEVLNGGANRADAMRQLLVEYRPQNVSEQILHREVVSAFHDFSKAR